MLTILKRVPTPAAAAVAGGFAAPGSVAVGAGAEQVESVCLDVESGLGGSALQGPVEAGLGSVVQREVGDVTAFAADLVLVVLGEVLSVLVAGEVVAGHDAGDCADLFEVTEEVAVRKAAVTARWMEAMGEFGILADAGIATSMLVGTLTAVWRGGLDVDPGELGERLWAALRAE